MKFYRVSTDGDRRQVTRQVADMDIRNSTYTPRVRGRGYAKRIKQSQACCTECEESPCVCENGNS